MKKVGLFVLVILLTVVAALPVSAASPVQFDFEGGGDIVSFDCSILGMGYDFVLNDRWTSTEHVQVFYNANGNVDWLISHAKGTDALYRADDPSGKTLVSDGSWVMTSVLLTEEPPTYEVTYQGPTYKFQLPGEKKIGFASGKITIVTDDAGNWLSAIIAGKGMPRWDFPAICAYFAE